ncbi:MAG: InaA protein [Azonexus sp.]|jgi:tRNA A-37 threonylcarbamoyl transferase component Bud32|nr:InaA protein [Azonexus sp.]
MRETSEFDRWWNRPGSWVEPPNIRRGGESGVQLLLPLEPGQPPLFSKRQVGHIYRSLLHPFGRPTILREIQVYCAFSRLGIATPKLVYGAARRQPEGWRGLLITEALQGFVSLEQWYESARPAALRAAVMRQAARVVARMHRAGWQHGCLYAKHIFVKAENGAADDPAIEIALLDLEKARRRWQSLASRNDMGQLARHCGKMPDSDLEIFRAAYRAALRGQ